MNIVPFDPCERILNQAKKYIADPRSFITQKEHAIPILIKALKYGDGSLRREILLLLGTFAKEEVCTPLYEIMTDPEEPDDLKDQAAVQISVLGPFLDDPLPLVRKLVSNLQSDDENLRVRSIIALGWEGNTGAALPLIECLYDADEEIQEVAVSALCNLNDSRVIRLLADRLRICSLDQKRAILFNLWRFNDRQEEVAAIYHRELQCDDSLLRQDIVTLLGNLTYHPHHETIYRSLMQDPDPKIRALVLERLGKVRAITIEDALHFLDDPDMEVKRAAMKILHTLKA